ncbi:MAG: hypothetical protein RLZZ67_335 [Candidatus Parcubacteria bacterium]|jgi:hypothetical protein
MVLGFFMKGFFMADVLLLTTQVRLTVDYGLSVENAIKQGGYTPSRMTQLLQTRRDFRSYSAEKKTVVAHITCVQMECRIGDVLPLAQDNVPKGIVLRQPKDIREVLALGPYASQRSECSLAIVAPHLVSPGLANLILKLLKYPEWMGLIPNTWDPEHDRINQYGFVAFSDPV